MPPMSFDYPNANELFKKNEQFFINVTLTETTYTVNKKA